MAEPKHWMQKATSTMHKGGLHSALGVPVGKKISPSKLAEAARSKNPHMRKMVSLAETFSKFRGK